MAKTVLAVAFVFLLFFNVVTEAKRSCWTSLGLRIGGAAAVGVAAPLALGAAGFTGAGIAAGSAASAVQSMIGNVAKGSMFSAAQSIAAKGAVTGYAAGGWSLSSFFVDDDCEW